MRLSIYLNKKPRCAPIWPCAFNFFIEKLNRYETTAQTHHSLSTYKMLPCLLINLRKPNYVELFEKAKRNTVSISPTKVTFHTLTEHAGREYSYFGQTYNLWFYRRLKFDLGKIWNKLNRCAKILINQPTALIFSGCAHSRKIDNQLFVAL